MIKFNSYLDFGCTHHEVVVGISVANVCVGACVWLCSATNETTGQLTLPQPTWKFSVDLLAG